MPEPRSVPRRMSAGILLVDRHGRVLMQLRDDDDKIMFPGHWGIIGGASQANETPEQAARRETLEETGLEIGRIEPFRAYYFNEKRAQTGKRPPTKAASDYELYLFHAPCETPLAEMTCGEGQELRFLGPDDIASLDIAYNHREVLEDFFASPAFGRYVRGDAFTGAGDALPDPVEHFRTSLDAGEPWFEALMQAIALWQQPEEQVGARRFRYLLGGEAFDWLLLAERLLEDMPDAVPEDEAARLLFEGRTPHDEHARISDEHLRELIGETKHRAHLNYVYGVTVEEALQYAVELDLAKERVSVTIKDPRDPEHVADPLYERIYGRPRAELLAEFRAEQGTRMSDTIALSELREFMYWLFKYRVKNAEPARVASDTRKALAQLSSMEDAVRRARTRKLAAREPEEVFAAAE